MGTDPKQARGVPLDDTGHPVRFGYPTLPDIAALGIAVIAHRFGLAGWVTNDRQ